MSESNEVKIQVYLDDGRIYEYTVASTEKAREHAQAIINTGYRSTRDCEMTHYPPHRIVKVKCVGQGIRTNYPDKLLQT